jgi:hypothetical protein
VVDTSEAQEDLATFRGVVVDSSSQDRAETLCESQRFPHTQETICRFLHLQLGRTEKLAYPDVVCELLAPSETWWWGSWKNYAEEIGNLYCS